MLLQINQENPQERLINRAVEALKQGGLIAYPTDTTYGIGCNIFNSRGVKNIYQVKKRDARKPFSFICADLSVFVSPMMKLPCRLCDNWVTP